MSDLILFWHRRDLRISDHTGLAAARKKTPKIVGVFCLDPQILEGDDIAPARVKYMIGCLQSLQERYRQAGSQLLILQNDPVVAIPQLAVALNAKAVFWNWDVEPYSQIRDLAVIDVLKTAGIEFLNYNWDQLLHSPMEIFSGGKTPYTIYEIPHFLTDAECDDLMKLSKPFLEDSDLYNGNMDINKKDGINNPDVRISKQCWLHNSENAFADWISDKVVTLTGRPKEHQEPLQVVKYEKGGHFSEHYDACYGPDTFCERMNSKIGPRYITVLIYLNDDYKGGGTTFTKINQHITPEKGKAILFYNVDKNGKHIYESMHQGNKIESGTKWIANKWIKIPINHRTFWERILW